MLVPGSGMTFSFDSTTLLKSSVDFSNYCLINKCWKLCLVLI